MTYNTKRSFFHISPQKKHRLIEGLIKVIILLNLVDLVLTLIWIGAGKAVEGNPLLQNLAHEHPILFVVVKTALVFLGTWFLWLNRHRAAAVIGIFIIFLAYYFTLLLHLHFFGYILRDLVPLM